MEGKIVETLRHSNVTVNGDIVFGIKPTTVLNGPSVEEITTLIEVIMAKREASYEFIEKLLDANSNLATAYIGATKQEKKASYPTCCPMQLIWQR